MATLSDLPTPSMIVDRERLDRNITEMAARMRAGGVRLRPHFKTSKCLEVARLQLAEGAIGFTCSTPAEVTLLQDAGIGDLLWAHQPVGPAKVAFAVEAARRGGLMVALDSAEAASPLSAAAAAVGVEVPFLMEVDTGLGRAGVDPERAVPLAAVLQGLPALRLCGVMTHEGHLGGYRGDRPALEKAGHRAGATLAAVGDGLRAAGHDCEIVSVGSTPGASSAPFADGVTEARPGTYVYYDSGQVALETVSLDRCAQAVLTRVISAQRAGTIIIDAGTKAMSSDLGASDEGLGTVCDDHGNPLAGVRFARANEEHGYLEGPGTDRLAVGDVLRIIPNHACGTTNMWSRLHVLAGDRPIGEWAIAARH